MSKAIFQTFPINTVVEWETETRLKTGWIVGYSLNSVGETVVEVELICPIERSRCRVYLHPTNAMIKLTAVVSGEYLYESTDYA